MRCIRMTQHGMAVLVIPAMLATVATGIVHAEAPPAHSLGTLISMAATSAPAVAKADRDWQTALSNLANAQADLGWKATLASGRTASVSHDADGAVSADLQMALDVTRVVTPGSSLTFSADQVAAGLHNGVQKLDAGTLTAGWAMRLGGTTLPQVQAVRDLTRTAAQKAAALDQARESTVNAVSKAYFDYLKARLDVQVAQKQLTSSKLQLEGTKALAQVGRAIGTDVKIAEQRLAATQADLDARTLQVGLALRDLSRLVGQSQETLANGDLAEPTLEPSVEGAADSWLAQAQARPEVRLAQLSLEAAEDAVAAARQTQGYEVTPLVSYDTAKQQLGLGLDMAKTKDAGNGSLSASLRVAQGGAWTVNTSFATTLGGADTAAKNALALSNAQAALLTAQASLAQTREDARETVRALWADLQSKKLQRELQLSLLAREQLNHDTVTARSQIGAVAPADLAAADLALAQADTSAKKALYDEQLAYVKLLAAVNDKSAFNTLEGL